MYETMSSALAVNIREELLQREGIQRIAPVRRGTTIYGPESQADSVYFVDSGYVKLVKRGDDGKEVMLSIIPPGKIFGEQAIAPGGVRGVSAQMLQEGALYQIPRAVFVEFANASPDVWRAVAELMMERQHEYEQKIALLCLQDVEYRILHYLASLSTVFGINPSDGQEYSLPLSQSELAHLIGATRETTSTTLNNLARRGLIRLGRRLLIVNTIDGVRAAAKDRVSSPKQISAAQA
jgi:CRP-like cAMP-binding protein